MERKKRSNGKRNNIEKRSATKNPWMHLYEILGIERTASQQETKKEAKEKFQILQNVISVLGDEEKRAIYDQTGYVDDVAFSSEAAENLQQFFKSMFRKVIEADIEEFEANYRGSDSEKKDLKALCKRFKGNRRRLFCSMLCSDPKLDSHRFKDIINEAIARGVNIQTGEEVAIKLMFQSLAKEESTSALQEPSPSTARLGG